MKRRGPALIGLVLLGVLGLLWYAPWRSGNKSEAIERGEAPTEKARPERASVPESVFQPGAAPPAGGSPAWKDSVAAALLSRRWDLSEPGNRAELTRRLRDAAVAEERYARATAERLGLPRVTPEGAVLVGFEGAVPIYEIDENVNAGISINAHSVRQAAPYSVDGSGWMIGLWEAGGVPRLTHVELGGRVTLGDSVTTQTAHATHVAGTLIAQGINSSVKGMAPGASLRAHASGSDTSEMALLAMAAPGEAGKMPVSNHSYAEEAGWASNIWYGVFSNDGDPANDYPSRFGRYTSSSAAWDGVMWNAPYYVAFKSGGNNRDDSPPSPGNTWRLNGSITNTFSYNEASHPPGDWGYRVSGGKSGFDTLTQKAVTKNAIAVGAVADAVTGGARDVSKATLTAFSSFGPTDDGRIKPDLVTNGSSVLSLDDDSNTDTATISGTSMSAPGACGSALLLLDYFEDQLPGQGMLGSTVKALLLHTADDLGNAGPDYRFGWGLMDTLEAADLILDHASVSTKGRLIEGELSGAVSFHSYPIEYSGSGPLVVTLCWVDAPGTGSFDHDSRTPQLVHDLNVRIEGPGGEEFLPWVMPWTATFADADLDAPAVKGVNTVDNVEQVRVAAPPGAGTYVVTVDYEGVLSQGVQPYSLVISGGSFPRGYGLWAAQQYPGQWSDAGVAGFEEDGEGDSWANGIEYAFGLAGDEAEGSDAIYTLGEETVGMTEYLTLTYERDTLKTDISYVAEWSDDLELWTPMAAEVIATEGTLETVKAKVSKDGRLKFARLRVIKL